MKIYSYNDNGIFIYESVAKKDPLEEDKYLLPNKSTFKKPLEFKDNCIIKWNGEDWEYCSDIVYTYDNNFYYEKQFKLDKNNNYQLPRNSTFKEPVVSSEYKAIKWNGEDWEYEDLDINTIRSNKLQQLDNYHFNSSEIREMKINDYFILSLSGNGRNLIAEQIQSLEQQIKLNVITEESATFEYFYNGGSIEITLVQLRQLYIFMLNVVNTNYGVYKAHIHAIKNLSTIEEVEAYDFTANYLKNQNLNIE